MVHQTLFPARREEAGRSIRRTLFSLPLLPLQPLLAHVARRIAAQYPELFARLGPHADTVYLIDPADLPFALLLRPKPGALLFKAVRREDQPACGATISGTFLHLLRLVDANEDGDAAFFSRDLTISGDVEAVVSLRNALDDVDGSIAESAAALFGPPGRFALDLMRRAGGWGDKRQGGGKDEA